MPPSFSSHHARHFPRLLPLLATSLLASCAPTTTPLDVEVRDRVSHQPAAGVRVFADVPSRDHAFSIASILGTTGPVFLRGVTDEHGRARLAYIAGRPVRLGVLEAGWCPGTILIEPDSALFDSARWYPSEDTASAGERLAEYRVMPAATSR